MTRKFIKTNLTLFFLYPVFVCLALVACSGADRITTPADELPQIVTLGTISSGSSVVTIPLSVIDATASDVDGITIDIYANGTLTSLENISGTEYYHQTLEAIRFSISGLTGGETIDIVINIGHATAITYSGTASASADVTATETESESVTLGALSGGASLVTIPLLVIDVTSSEIENITIDTYINDVLASANMAAESNYDETLSAVQFSITGLAGGETAEITLDFGDGTTITYTGTISASADATATATETPE
ncbi:MAG: hypothetical protein HQM16_10385 [Deltaproteobacteria bacterium]|nr:hypothetical protein [Deltaproteobacteria bacterium]